MKVSVVSLVVPAMSDTIARFTPLILFTSDDLPTLGFPMIATLIISSSSSSSSHSGRYLSTSSSKSPVPCPCDAETATGSPKPRL